MKKNEQFRSIYIIFLLLFFYRMICKISKKPEWKLKPMNTYSKAAQDFVMAELNSQNPEVNIN